MKRRRTAPSTSAALGAGAAVVGASQEAAPVEAVPEPQPAKLAYRFVASAREDHGRPIYSVAFCTAGGDYDRFFGTVGVNRATVYEALSASVNPVQSYSDPDKEECYYACAWTVDPATGAPLFIAAGFRGLIRVIDCSKREVTLTLAGHGNAVNDVSVSPVDPMLLLSASKDESVRLWNLTTGHCIAVFAGDLGHREEVLSVDFHLLGSTFASSGMDNTVKLWSLRRPALARAIEASRRPPSPDDPRPFPTHFSQFPEFSTGKVHDDYVDCVRWVGDLVMSKSIANSVSLWRPDVSKAKDGVSVVRLYTLTNTDIWFIKFGLDAQLQTLAIGNRAGKLFLFDVDSPTNAPALQLSAPHARSTMRHTCFSRDGSVLLCVDDEACLWRWDRDDAAEDAAAAHG